MEDKVLWIFEKLEELYDFLNEEKIRYVSAAFLALGFLVGYFLSYHGEEKPPYAVWLEKNKHIKVVQEKGSNVYDFRPVGDGFYEFRSVLDPKHGENR